MSLIKLCSLFILILFVESPLRGQLFIPYSYYKSNSITISTIPNTEAPQNVQVAQPLVITNLLTLNCTSTFITATSSNLTVLTLANITFSGVYPNCVVSFLSTANTGTSNVTITVRNEYNQTATTSFTFTAYQKPVMAFSFRKVLKDYIGSAIRVRRISDNAESDIGFDGSGNLDITAYNAFRGASSLRLKTWYDQSGNGYNAVQNTNTLQPMITTNGFNGAPQVEFNNTYWLSTTQAGNIITSNRDLTIFYATKAISESRTIFGVRDNGNNRVGSHINWSDNFLYWDSPGVCCSNSRLSFNNAANINIPKTYTMGRNNGYQYIKVNGVDAVTRTDATGTLTTPTRIWYLGATNDIGTANELVSSPLAEYVQYLSGLTDSQVTVIANEQKNYFGL